MSTQPDRSKVLEHIETYLRMLDASKESLADAIVEQGTGLVTRVGEDKEANIGCHLKGVGGHCKG